MRPLSAIEAFSPALERTKAMLVPFSLPRVIKLGLIAILAEMSGQFISPPVSSFHHSASHFNPLVGAITAGIVLAVGLIIFAIGLLFLYFSSRMQFVFMELVATRTSIVGPSWRRFGPKTWPWIGIKVACTLGIFIVVGAIVALPLIHLFRSLPAGSGQPPNPAFWGSFFLIFIVAFIAVFFILLVIWTLRDFVLPFMVFENATATSALSSAFEFIRLELPSVLFYFLMKLIFSMLIGIAAELCLVLVVLIGAIPMGVVGGIFWFALHHAGIFGTIFLYVTLGLLGLVFAVFFAIVGICIGGAALIFNQAYALYFMGGRIPALGNLLEPPPPPLAEMPPAFVPA